MFFHSGRIDGVFTTDENEFFKIFSKVIYRCKRARIYANIPPKVNDECRRIYLYTSDFEMHHFILFSVITAIEYGGFHGSKTCEKRLQIPFKMRSFQKWAKLATIQGLMVSLGQKLKLSKTCEKLLFLVFTHVMRRPCWYTKQWQNVAQVLHNNGPNSQKTFFAIVVYTNMVAVTSRENRESNQIRVVVCKTRLRKTPNSKNGHFASKIKILGNIRKMILKPR